MAMDMIRYGGLLFLVSLSGIWAAVVQLDPATKVLLHRNARSASCVVDGNTYADGTNFTIKASWSCTTYICNNGNASVISSSCGLYGQCLAVGSTLDVGNCTIHICASISSNGVTQAAISPPISRCLYQGQCVGNLRDVVSDCVTRTCYVQYFSNGTTLKSMKITSVQCQDDNGACYASGQRLTKTIAGSGTLNCLCTVNGTSVSYSDCS